jgi:hypothetical protein
MNPLRQFLLIFSIGLFLTNASAFAQETAVLDTVETPLERHSPKKATIMSAALPGLGQIYNKKVWKLPIIYAGIGTCIYFIDRNNTRFQRYKDALIAASDNDPNTVNDTGFSTFQLDQLQETYRSWRDLSWIILAGVYVLNIIDANVDAHLFYFDVDKDLSLELRPDVRSSWGNSAGVIPGLSLSLNF